MTAAAAQRPGNDCLTRKHTRPTRVRFPSRRWLLRDESAGQLAKNVE